jgi:hypothetical protein
MVPPERRVPCGSHPGYVDADWPYTQDFGIVILDQPVYLAEYGALPEVGLLDELIPATGQTAQRFTDVGYGQTGVRDTEAALDWINSFL